MQLLPHTVWMCHVDVRVCGRADCGCVLRAAREPGMRLLLFSCKSPCYGHARWRVCCRRLVCAATVACL